VKEYVAHIEQAFNLSNEGKRALAQWKTADYLQSRNVGYHPFEKSVFT
jgi:hypothetical protein